MTERRYTAVPRALCFILKDDDVLLLRGAPTKRLWANRLNGVGGHVEADESIEAAALREITEETGLTVRNLRLRGVLNQPPNPALGTGDANTGVLLCIFTAEAAGGTLTPSAEGTLAWYPQRLFTDDALPELLPDLMEDLRILLPRALAAEQPFCS